MARIRSVKPELWADEGLARMSRDSRLLFVALFNFADDEGRMRGNSLFVRSQCFPYDADVDVDALLDELHDGKFVMRYETAEQQYVWIKNFKKHQKIDKPSPSGLPAPPAESSWSPRRALAEASPSPPRTSDESSASTGNDSVRRSLAESSPSPRSLARARGIGLEGNGEGKDLELAANEPAASATPKAAALGKSEHKLLVDHGVKAIEKAIGAKYGFRDEDGKHAKDLLQRFGLEESCQLFDFAVDRYRGDEFHRKRGLTFRLIANDANVLRSGWANGRLRKPEQQQIPTRPIPTCSVCGHTHDMHGQKGCYGDGCKCKALEVVQAAGGAP